MPLLHGPMGEDGTVQGCSSWPTCRTWAPACSAPQSAWTRRWRSRCSPPTASAGALRGAPRAHEITPGTPARLADELGLPVFVKPANMGSSVGVSKAKTVEAIRDAIDVALSYDEWVVVEEAIVGREIEVAVLGNLEPRASVPGEIVPGAEFYDYADKYVDDGSQCIIPAPLTAEQTAEVQALALTTFRAMRCEGLSRVDFFFEEGGRGFLLNEINTMPGFTPISMYPKMWIASGLTYSELIDEMVRLAFERHARRRRNTAH
jgi:D-alanine--D-alanine ligase